MSPQTAASSIFEDHDRERAHKRLDAIDNLGAERLIDALWPAEQDKRRALERFRRDGPSPWTLGRPQDRWL